MMGETIVNMMLKLDGIDSPNIENTHANRIRVLKKEGLIPKNIDDILCSLRVIRNDAIHQNFEDVEKCKTLIFTDKAVDEIYKYSAGSARAINKVCTHSLLSAAQRNKKLIDDHMVHMVIESELP